MRSVTPAIKRIAHARAADLLVDNPYAERAARDARVDLGELELMIRPYAERAEWTGLLVEAEQHLDDVDGGDEPLHWVSGAEWFPNTVQSPAWKLAGYGAVAGFHGRQRYGILVRNRQKKTNVLAHAIVVDPATTSIHEAFERANGTWTCRTYSPTTEGLVAKTAVTGPDSILDDCHRSSYEDLDDATHPVVELLEAAGEMQRA